jgi:hypothetical protein
MQNPIYVIQSWDTVMHDVFFLTREKAEAYLTLNAERWKNIKGLKVRALYLED